MATEPPIEDEPQPEPQIVYSFQADITRPMYGRWRFGWLAADGVPFQAMMQYV